MRLLPLESGINNKDGVAILLLKPHSCFRTEARSRAYSLVVRVLVAGRIATTGTAVAAFTANEQERASQC
jgi:hypothetical protein